MIQVFLLSIAFAGNNQAWVIGVQIDISWCSVAPLAISKSESGSDGPGVNYCRCCWVGSVYLEALSVISPPTCEPVALEAEVAGVCVERRR